MNFLQELSGLAHNAATFIPFRDPARAEATLPQNRVAPQMQHTLLGHLANQIAAPQQMSQGYAGYYPPATPINTVNGSQMQGAIQPQLQSLINGYAQPSYPAMPMQGSGRQVQPSWDDPNQIRYNGPLSVL